MKKEFEMPKLMVSKFNAENIVTSSGIKAAQEALGTQGVTTDAITEVDFEDMFSFQ